MVTELFYPAITAQNGQAANPLIREFARVLCRVSGFKELARAYYFEVVLSPYRCPLCEGRVQMTGQSQCACACGNGLDPTLVFQQSDCCGAKLIRKTFHYACSKCNKTVQSRFLFDERVFDPAYFREMMQESRARAKKKREEVKSLLMGSRSDALFLMDEPCLESIPGLDEALNGFIGTDIAAGCAFAPKSGFRMGDYRNHILSILGVGSRLFSDITPLTDDRRRDKIWRFVTLTFMAQDREVELTQYGADILVGRVGNEAYG
jgi:hypothetical protein